MNTEQRDTGENHRPIVFGRHIDGTICYHADVCHLVPKELGDAALPQIPKQNAAGIAYPSIEEQEKFWEQRDIGGNTTPDRIEANQDQYFS